MGKTKKCRAIVYVGVTSCTAEEEMPTGIDSWWNLLYKKKKEGKDTPSELEPKLPSNTPIKILQPYVHFDKPMLRWIQKNSKKGKRIIIQIRKKDIT